MEKSKLEWNNDEMFLLIDLYKEKPCLWDPTNKEYKLKTRRNDCWLEIANIFNCDVSIVKKKMESLLTSFRRERQKCEETKKSGAGLDELYTSTWFAFEKMKFLLDKFSPRPTQDTMDFASETQDISLDSDDSAPSMSKIFKSPNSNLKRVKSNMLDKRAEEAYYNMQEAVKRRNERDQSSIFGEHVAYKHRVYSSHTKCVVEHLISNILFEADIGKYENYLQDHHPSSWTPTPTNQYPIPSDLVTIDHSPSRTPTPTLLSDLDNQSPSSTSTPTLLSETPPSSCQSQSQNLPANQSVSLLNNKPKQFSSSSSSGGIVTGPKKITVLRSLILKNPKHNLQNIPPNEEVLRSLIAKKKKEDSTKYHPINNT